MTREQVDAVYRHLQKETSDPAELLRQLLLVEGDFNALEAVLYVPMYSMGMGQASITPRIAALRAIPFTIESAISGRLTMEAIKTLDIGDNTLFGMPNRVRELFDRAAQIANYGVERIAFDLKPIDNWTIQDLVVPFTRLRGFTGVGDKAALHILMDTGWGVVKPDRHICRFLSRIGGEWQRYFLNGRQDDLLAPLMLPFVRDWRDTCAGFAVGGMALSPEGGEISFPPLTKLTSRQIDILIMWFTQDRARREIHWRPAAVCGDRPICQKCTVPDCFSRS